MAAVEDRENRTVGLAGILACVEGLAAMGAFALVAYGIAPDFLEWTPWPHPALSVPEALALDGALLLASAPGMIAFAGAGVGLAVACLRSRRSAAATAVAIALATALFALAFLALGALFLVKADHPEHR